MNHASGNLRRNSVLALLALIAILTWVSPFDQPASDSIDAGLKRAFATFAVARGLNAVISMAQGTEVTVGVGASATFSIGQILDPVNDLIEQFADLMLLATIAFAIQKALLLIGGHGALKLALVILIVVSAGLYFTNRKLPRTLVSLLILGLMARFAIPVATVGSDAMFRAFLQEQYEESERALVKTEESIKQFEIAPTSQPGPKQSEKPTTEVPTKQKSMLDQAKEMLGMDGASPEAAGEPGAQPGPSSSGQDASNQKKSMLSSWWPDWKVPDSLNFSARLAELRKTVSASAEHVVRQIVVFLLQTLIFPLAILWILFMLAKNALGSLAGGSRSEGSGDPQKQPGAPASGG